MSIKKLALDIESISQEELVRANKFNPPFNSMHEGIAVIDEEVIEAKAEMIAVLDKFEKLKMAVYQDKSEAEINYWLNATRKSAEQLSCEAIQVIAMCYKFADSEDEKCRDKTL